MRPSSNLRRMVPIEALTARASRSSATWAFRKKRGSGSQLHSDSPHERFRQNVREDSGSLQLEIRGIDPQSSDFAGIGQLEEAQQPEPPQAEPARGWLRLLRSAGLGSLGAFLICCALPMGLVAVFGIGLSLTALDNPWVIAPGAIALGALYWRWEKRREAARAKAAAPAQSCGC